MQASYANAVLCFHQYLLLYVYLSEYIPSIRLPNYSLSLSILWISSLVSPIADNVVSLYHHRSVDPLSIKERTVSGILVFQIKLIVSVKDHAVYLRHPAVSPGSEDTFQTCFRLFLFRFLRNHKM